MPISIVWIMVQKPTNCGHCLLVIPVYAVFICPYPLFCCWLHSLLQLLCILSFGRSHWGRPLAHSFTLPGDLTIRIYCKSLFFINVYVISPPPSQTSSQSGQRGLVLCLAATALFGLNPFHSTMFSYWLAVQETIH